MNRLLVLALGAPMLLIGAAYPDKISAEEVEAAPAPLQQAGPARYRPCRPGPGDDRCIQLYERGVREAYARWRGERGEIDRRQVAMGGPLEQAAPRHPRRHRVASRPGRCGPGHEAPRHRHAPRHEPPPADGDGEALGM